MLELWSEKGAFEALEAYLRDAGFDGAAAEGLVADVYLGYGLAEGLRRRPGAAPPEPCALPLVACRIRREDEVAPAAGAYRIGAWERSWTDGDYTAAIEAVQAAIARGDVYQVNLVQHLSAPFSGDPAGLGAALAPLEPLVPEPLAGESWTIVSASPELFLARRGRRLWTAPIKGTRPVEAAVELGGAEKDAAEHVMIVDLERNDLSRVCEPGSVHWPELMVEREAAGVAHLVSTVEGRLREDVSLAELLEATFPGGSVTGAPKIAAVDQIAALEPVGRGASMGALGRIRPGWDLELALTIRTFAVVGDRIHLWVGGGIVWDSEPGAEIEESWVKARPLLAALGAPLPVRELVVSLLGLAVGGRGAVDPEEPVLHADDEALLRGRAAFETMRVYGGRPFRLDDHLRRLASSSERIGLPALDPAELRTLAGDALAAGGSPDAVLRLLWTGGREGGDPVALALVSAVPEWIEGARARGQRAISLLGVRAQAPWLLGGVKSTSYAVNMAAEAEARARGADDAVFVDANGIVLEGPVTNWWWRRGSTLLTPSLGLGILPGVTRAVILEVAGGLGYEVCEGAYACAELAGADEAFTSSSVRELLPVVELDGAPVGDGTPGPAAKELQAALRRLATGDESSRFRHEVVTDA